MTPWKRQFRLTNLTLLAAVATVGIVLWSQGSVPATAQTPKPPATAAMPVWGDQPKATQPAQPQNTLGGKPTVPRASLPSFGEPDPVRPPIAPGPANLPAFAHGNPQETMRYYLKQITGNRIPTLEDYSKLLTLPEAKGLKFPMPLGADHFVMSMCTDYQNNLWIGTEGEGLFRFNPTDGTFIQFVANKNPPPDGNPPIPESAIECGMGDNYVYALACDQQGRVWVGHLNHGVSVFNGDKFQSYEVVAGLSRPDSLNGPLGERIFHITVAPKMASATRATFHDSASGKDSEISGSVWMCTSAGLAVYFPSTDTWSYITRADGMPSDQANSIAFAADGTVFVATQCDGVAIGSPEDHYQSFRQIALRAPHLAGSAAATLPAFAQSQAVTATLPSFSADPSSTPGEIDKRKTMVRDPLTDELPTTPTGSGIPSNLMNDILVANDGTVYAVTTAGLAWSNDKGDTWQFVRGLDWADKVRQRRQGPPEGWTAAKGAILAEDYCTALAEDSQGRVHVGHRAVPAEAIQPRAKSAASTTANTPNTYCTAIIASSGGLLLGTYGNGLTYITSGPKELISSPHPPVGITSFPAGARVMVEQPSSIVSSTLTIVNLSDDWLTQGNWMGRIGRAYTVLAGMHSPESVYYPEQYPLNIFLSAQTGKAPAMDSIRSWIQTLYTDDSRALEMPPEYLNPRIAHKLTTEAVRRRDAQWDDHGEVYSRNLDGPNLYLRAEIPEGWHILSLYFCNDNAHTGLFNASRDYAIEIRGDSLIGTRSSFTALDPQLESYFSLPILARERVSNYYGGVYKRFLVRGGAAYTIKIDRNYSLNATCSAFMMDKVESPAITGLGGRWNWIDQPFALKRWTSQVEGLERQADTRFGHVMAASNGLDFIHRSSLVGLLRTYDDLLKNAEPLDRERLMIKANQCDFDLGLFVAWERNCDELELTTPREDLIGQIKRGSGKFIILK